jgi:hypothetical protein
MTTSARFNKFEETLREAARQTLANPGASPVEKRFARTVLNQTLEEARGRFLHRKAKAVLGPKPAAPGPALDAWRDGLKRLKCEEILDDPGSSLAHVRMAERTLKEIEARERQRGAAITWPEVSKKRPAREEKGQPPPDPNAQAFLDTLAGRGEPPAPQSAPRVAEAEAVKTVAPNLGPGAEDAYLDQVCPLCLIARRICSCSKKDDERR